MSALTTTAQPTMTSAEIATLVDSRHDSVKRAIERLAEKGAITLPPTVEVSNDGPGPKTIAVYLIGKRDSYVIVAQLSPEFTARLVDRWQELEEQARNPITSLSRIDLLKLALDSEEKRLQLEQKVETMQITVAAHERLAKADGSVCITNAAKDLQMRPKDLFAWMTANQWIYRRPGGSGWLAYQSRIQVGYLEHKVTTVSRGDGSEKVVEQVLVTSKGLARLAERLSERLSERKAQPVSAADT